MAKICKKCGAVVGAEDKYCTACGYPQESSSAQETDWEKTQEEAEGAFLREPISLGGYLLMFLIACIPVANLVIFLIWAFGKNTNLTRKNFARAGLIFLAAGTILGILLIVWIVSMVTWNAVQYQEYYEYPYTDTTPYHNRYHDGVEEIWEMEDLYLIEEPELLQEIVMDVDAAQIVS